MSRLKMRVRFDFMARGKANRFFGGKTEEEQAEELRQHKVSLIRNVPLQGIIIDEIDMSHEIYSIYDDISGKSLAFAPVSISLTAASMEDAIKFTMKEEFRTVEILEPEDIKLSKTEIERLMYRMCEELLEYKEYLEKKVNNWK